MCNNTTQVDVSNIINKNGLKIALLSYTTSTDEVVAESYAVNIYSDEKVKSDIEKIKDKVDLIIVSMHWGEEYTHTPTYEEKNIANYLASLGVNIVIGTHPHVIQPIDFIGDTMVIYSLGNFLSSQIGIERLTGLMASVTIKKTVVDGVSIITLEDPAAELVYTKKPSYGVGYKLYPFSKLNDSIFPGYKTYYEKYINIATNGSRPIRRIGY